MMVISDDGVGFNDGNLASFKEAHTLSKVKVGGKGVGRFTFLKEHYATPTVARLVEMANLVATTRDTPTLLRVVNG